MKCKCKCFELDTNIGSLDDEPCCQICRFNEPIEDRCLIGVEE